jgi:hypothetical protein
MQRGISVKYEDGAGYVNLLHFVQSSTKEKLEGIVSSELNSAGEISPKTWRIILLLQSALQPLVGFRPAQLSLSILSRRVLQSAVASGASNPQLGGEPGI